MFLYMYRASSAHLQEDTVVYMQHMVVTLFKSSWWPVGTQLEWELKLCTWLLFIHKILFSSTCFEPQVLIFRRIQLYTCSIWYCHRSWWPVGTQLEWELKLCTWLLFIHKILFSSTCFEPQVLIFRRLQLYTCSIRYCHSSWWPVGTQLEWELKLCTDRPPRTVIVPYAECIQLYPPEDEHLRLETLRGD